METSDVVYALPLLILSLGSASCLVPGLSSRGLWRVAQGTAFAALGAAIGASIFFILDSKPVIEPIFRLNSAACFMLLLVSFLGLVVVRFSMRYLDGEARQRTYASALLATLASVMTIIVSNEFAVLIIAWIASSVALNRLLVFYPERAAAHIAAHKEFLVSRTADALFILSALLLYSQFATLRIDAMAVQLGAMGGEYPWEVSVAACLFVLGVTLKSAQLPAHGWLIQVMEAPTPVSALLHAGVVNLGGFILIGFGFLLDAIPAAQWLLVGIGSVTTLLAALSMLTRASIKVRLAWSTIAQMGFMMMECGLGLYTLALAHLIGHSLYKAHAFLGSGSVVQDTSIAQLIRAPICGASALRWISPIAALLVCAGLAWLSSELVVQGFAAHPIPLLWLSVLALAFAPGLWLARFTDWRELPGALLGVVGLFLALQAGHFLLGQAGLQAGAARGVSLQGMAVVALLGLYVMQAMLVHGVRPHWVASFGAKAFAGFDMDNWMSPFVLRGQRTSRSGFSGLPALRTFTHTEGEQV
ncbi:NADH-quinone oxidoreductase subunit L [Alcaligenaceae bacterium CGII-47]|nr:NADH-quinone oxidoreductase subunit L [Alcaligenaceae bacterium CGII-47]